jgi:protein-S-isoprenylcysteine O-methyltransferase
MVLPPLLILLRLGEMAHDWPWVRALGMLFSLYAVVMLVWTPRALGQLLVLKAVIYDDHHLVTHGPFRYLRHPSYSGVLALWLGAALGTLDWVLLALWVPAAIVTAIAARAEDELLRARFGLEYEAWADDVGEFVPACGAKRA